MTTAHGSNLWHRFYALLLGVLAASPAARAATHFCQYVGDSPFWNPQSSITLTRPSAPGLMTLGVSGQHVQFCEAPLANVGGPFVQLVDKGACELLAGVRIGLDAAPPDSPFDFLVSFFMPSSESLNVGPLPFGCRATHGVLNRPAPPETAPSRPTPSPEPLRPPVPLPEPIQRLLRPETR